MAWAHPRLFFFMNTMHFALPFLSDPEGGRLDVGCRVPCPGVSWTWVVGLSHRPMYRVFTLNCLLWEKDNKMCYR